jgi:hypothetical protein
MSGCRRFVTFVIMAAVSLSAGTARATLLSPGNAVPAVGAARPGGVTLLDSRAEAFTSFTGSGLLTSQVLTNDSSNPFGLNKLTFTYKLDNTDADGVPSEIFELTVASFAGFQTDVSYDSATTTGMVAPTFVQRGATPGEQVVFSFLNPPIGVGSIGSGFSSAVLVVQTNAASYAETVSSISGALAPNVHTLAPIAVPEPASLGLIAAAALLIPRRRRRRSTR